MALFTWPALCAAPAPEDVVPQSLEQVSLSFVPVVRKTAPAVVNIYTKRIVRERVNLSPLANDPFFRQFFGNAPAMQGPVRERVEGSLGSGVIIAADGLIVTSYHVIQNAQAITVALSDRRELEAEIVKRDPQSDLAFLRVHAPGPLPYLTMRDTDTLEVGELVLAIGNPFGVGQTVTHGIVSGLARTAAAGMANYQFFIQTDAAINPGNSGGALVDMHGRLLGINTAIYSTSGGSNGIGFAIPANIVKAVQAEEVKEGKVVRPWLGVITQDVTAEMADSLGLPAPGGVIVHEVTEGGPAEKGGIRPDDIIISFDGNAIADDRALQYRINTQRVGGTVEIGVLRKGHQQKMEVTLAALPQVKAEVYTLKGHHPLAGVTVVNLTPELIAELGITKAVDIHAVVVVSGEGAGGTLLQRGDIITQVNGKKVTSPPQLDTLLNAGGHQWQVLVQRGTQALTMTLRN
ncbi:MAG: Do family serine endopeptidase [Alphaproteobacteria bacterium]|nr:Do family serine endopeptidase [Alphaproteobacteria bacterium]